MMKINPEESTHRINANQQSLYPVAPYTSLGAPDPPKPRPEPLPPMPPPPGGYKRQRFVSLITRKAKKIFAIFRRQIQK